MQTFYECISNRLRTRYERFTNNVIPTHETPQNTPPGVGADSSCPYPNITKMHIPITQNAYSHNQIRISPPHFVCVYVYAGAINRPLQLLTVCQLRCEHSAKHSTYTHEMPHEHSARRRGPIHRARILTLPKCIFPLPNTHIRPPFRVYFPICGHDKSAPTAADGCQLRGEHSAKHSTYTYEMGCEHSARRRGRFIVPVS